MKRHTWIWIGIASLAFLASQRSFGVTIPAGAALVVRTQHGISSIDAPAGRLFPRAWQGCCRQRKGRLACGHKGLRAGRNFKTHSHQFTKTQCQHHWCRSGRAVSANQNRWGHWTGAVHA